ncbi:nuclear transport factor 2 family protein [Aquiflexum gelatinilyticum]|uniref:Nuclear transport factor 2 family protein n=1 Tax=Aquiflexum gelatinilyticum TaxID=2961943 RepID=A0A9X2P4T8_9BACT|nr:nuclear transport factor 2 family protein [Aquiflexum gelatinilyticum]MCR9015998.1 nuclear transport factor 2 family protein [Aquiflexum gelatinilyticum]MCS4436058.1 nuclear transport factor 2 family protein [Aquiflexum gelatinilyticum]
MKKIATIMLLCFLVFPSLAQTQEQQKLIDLDLGWEKALLESDVDFLENLLAADFIWVHNHANLIDGKEAVVAKAKRIQAGQANDTRGRKSRDHKVVVLGNTVVVSGYTVVDKGTNPVIYHFMRTYVKEKGQYKLLANHTMAIPDEELKGK